ncbi:hypothetical protein BN2475_190111 [Paraburkholderia ribeironis]|uniref:Uncharacterized protein n=1 Tax=Paraburkholderia ribeironis TaxID=1247936 RepID=A0A1N7RVQ5_9BURK|nr:hypothetical protein BN2475_190111 [Paraburkholderia ribeironis]
MARLSAGFRASDRCAGEPDHQARRLQKPGDAALAARYKARKEHDKGTTRARHRRRQTSPIKHCAVRESRAGYRNISSIPNNKKIISSYHGDIAMKEPQTVRAEVLRPYDPEPRLKRAQGDVK